MKIIAILKAQPTVDPIEAVKIVMDEEIPEIKNLEEAKDFYIEQGKELAAVLCSTLPGGTLDQLICELLTRKASLFRVPMFDNKKEE
jgi:hypothetical protein